MAIQEIVPYTGVVPKTTGLTVEQEIAACIEFREWEYLELAVKLITNTPELNKAMRLVNELYDSSNYKGEFDVQIVYAQGESVSIVNDIYLSKIDNNVSTPPSTDWVMIPQAVRTDDTDQDILGVKNFSNLPLIDGNPFIITGSNGNGHYIKFPDGSMIMRGRNYAYTGTGTVYLPTFFLDNTYSVVCTVFGEDSNPVVVQLPTTSRITGAFFVYGFDVNDQRVLVTFDYIAIGRWK